jgi:hypothetical protein
MREICRIHHADRLLHIICGLSISLVNINAACVLYFVYEMRARALRRVHVFGVGRKRLAVLGHAHGN